MARVPPYACAVVGPGRGQNAPRQRPHVASVRRPHAARRRWWAAAAHRTRVERRAVAVGVVEASRPHGGVGTAAARAGSDRCPFDIRPDHPTRAGRWSDGRGAAITRGCRRHSATRSTIVTSPTSLASWPGSTTAPPAFRGPEANRAVARRADPLLLRRAAIALALVRRQQCRRRRPRLRGSSSASARCHSAGRRLAQARCRSAAPSSRKRKPVGRRQPVRSGRQIVEADDRQPAQRRRRISPQPIDCSADLRRGQTPAPRPGRWRTTP